MDSLVMGVFGLTGCAGDQLSLLNCEDELLALARRVTFKSFHMASSREEPGELELALVEGSVCQPRDLELLREVRNRSKRLIALGTCASFGGLPSMEPRLDPEVLKETVYGMAGRKAFAAMRALPLSAFVKVDYVLPGCPVEKKDLLETISCLLKGEFPELLKVPVCAECRMSENVCLVIEDKEVCCGPLTRGGCGGRCPSLSRPCSGCHGPLDDASYSTAGRFFQSVGITREEILHAMQMFAPPSIMTERMKEELK